MYKRRYSDQTKQFVYQNCCDCLKYGYGFSTLNKCGLPDSEAKIIWRQAFEDMASDF